MPTETAQLRALLEAQRTISSDLSLGDMLDRITRAACELVGARYGALGVIAPDGSLEQFVHHGMDDATVARIGALPTGKGLLGVLIDDPQALRIDDIAADDRSVGFPPNHPRMRALLGVPIRVRSEVFGDLYLCEPAEGTFTAAHEELATALAGAAGTAIANARLYEDARRSRDWLRAAGEITRALLAEADVDTLLEVVSRALHVAEADFGALVLPNAEGRLVMTVAVGEGAQRFEGYVLDPADAAVIAAGHSVVLQDFESVASKEFRNEGNFGPLMLAPMVDHKGVRGAVLLIRTADRPPFTSRDLDLASTFADQVALALEMDDARNDAEWGRELEVRNRLAEDLHDNVMQRLFATGVGLQGLAKLAVPGGIGERLGRYIGELDETIDEIRERVFGLRQSSGADSLRARERFPHVPADDDETTGRVDTDSRAK